MTSKNLLSKLMLQDIKRRAWVPVISILSFFFAYIVATIYKLQYVANYSKTLLDDFERFKHQEFLRVTGAGNEYIFIILILFATICAISGFYFLFSKKQVDFYHSIPISRGKLFLIRYIDGLLITIVPMTIALIISAIIGGFNDIQFSLVIKELVAAYITNVLYYIILYSTTVIAVMLTGNLIVCILGTAVLLGYGAFLQVLLSGLFTFYDTFFKISNWALKLSSIYNFISMQSCIDDQNYRDFGLKLIVAIISAIVLTVTAYLLYRYRRSEAAMKSMAYEKTKPVIKFLLVIPMALMCGIIFNNLGTMNDKFSMPWMLFGLIFGTFFVYAVIEIIYHIDFRKAFAHKFQLLACFICVFAIFFGVKYDITNYDTYLPKKSNLSGLSIYIEGIDQYSRYMIKEDERNYKSYSAVEYSEEYVNLINVPGAYEMLQHIVKEELFTSSNYVFDRIQGKDIQWWNSIIVCYKKKNGMKAYRNYNVKNEDILSYLDQIYISKEYRDTVFKFYDGKNGAKISCNKDNISKDFNLSNDDMINLQNMYLDELRQINLSNLKTEYPIAYFDFPYDTDSIVRNAPVFIYPECVNTIAFLKEHGFDANREVNIDEIDNIYIDYYVMDKFRYNYPEVQTRDYQNVEKRYTDRDIIESIMEKAVMQRLFSHTNEPKNNDLVSLDVTFSDEYGNADIISYIINISDLPESIKADYYQ